jgi:hypothetical protein
VVHDILQILAGESEGELGRAFSGKHFTSRKKVE